MFEASDRQQRWKRSIWLFRLNSRERGRFHLFWLRAALEFDSPGHWNYDQLLLSQLKVVKRVYRIERRITAKHLPILSTVLDFKWSPTQAALVCGLSETYYSVNICIRHVSCESICPCIITQGVRRKATEEGKNISKTLIQLLCLPAYLHLSVIHFGQSQAAC